MSEEPRIVSDPGVLGGKPRIRGTRISVELILEELAAGHSIEGLLDDYPFLSEDDIRACLQYGAELASRPPAMADAS